MLSLHLFGGLSLTNSEGQVPTRASQRRRVALLAILATSRRRPVSRDKLVALLWPDSDSDRGRHLLADSIYVLRDSLGEDVLLTTADGVSLNSARVASDVGEFADALEQQDLARAVGIYSEGGSFLDGVRVSDAPEFERWADAMARELAADYRRALETLAKAASASGNRPEAAAWWRKLAVEERSSSRVALELMRALEASGDIAGALEFAGVHEKIVRVELDAAPDPSVIAFAAELRRRDGSVRAADATKAQRPIESSTSEVPPSRTVENNPARSGSPAPHTNPPTIASASIVDVPSGPTRTNRHILAWAVLIALLTGGIAVFRLRTAPPVSRAGVDGSSSIVVLPLRSVTPGAENESFADGMTEELISSLSAITRLRVIASTSAFAFKGHSTDIRRIADSLRVSNLLEGAVQRSGSRVRLSIRLVDASDGSTRWSDTYDRDLKDFFGVEDDIGKAVAAHLSLLLGAGAQSTSRHQTTVVEAYDNYIRGRHQRELRNDTAFKTAIKYFNQAIAADSNYAAAYAALSEVSALLAFIQNSRENPRSQLFARAQATAIKADQIDDSLPEAHLAEGFLASAYQINLSVAEKELTRALQLDPSYRRAHEYLAIVFDMTGRPQMAVAEARRAEALDPLSVTAVREVGRALYSARRYDEALAELNRAMSLGPPIRTAPLLVAQIYAKKKMYDQAIAQLHNPRISSAQAILGYILGLAGRTSEAAQILAKLTTEFDNGTGAAYDIAIVYAGLHDYDNAFLWLGRSFEDNSIRADIMDPLYDDLRADPRFERIRSRLGLQKL